MSTGEPYEIPGEEEEEEKKTGHRSAYFAGVHAGEEGFSGSYRGVKPAPHGGAASVREDDIRGSLTLCWCGDRYGHDWPGKDKGAKHPRGESMTSAATHEGHFDIGLLKQFDRRVAKMVADLANDYGVRVRIIDGGHAILYPLDDTRPFKIAAARRAEQQMEYIEKFARLHVAPALVTTQAAALAARFNDPTKKTRPKKEAPVPEPKAATPTPAPKVEAPEPVSETPPEGYEQHLGSRDGEVMNWWKKIGANEWLCKSCDHVVTGTLQGGGSHQRMHTLTPEERSAISAIARQHSDNELQGRRARARNAIKFLAQEYDIKLAGPQTRDDKKVARLEEQLAKVTAERDDYKARLDLMREAMRA